MEKIYLSCFPCIGLKIFPSKSIVGVHTHLDIREENPLFAKLNIGVSFGRNFGGSERQRHRG